MKNKEIFHNKKEEKQNMKKKIRSLWQTFHKKSSVTSVISFYQPTVHRVTGLYDNQIRISLYI